MIDTFLHKEGKPTRQELYQILDCMNEEELFIPIVLFRNVGHRNMNKKVQRNTLALELIHFLCEDGSRNVQAIVNQTGYSKTYVYDALNSKFTPNTNGVL